ncbi:MAG: hypothetical protein KGO81_13660, partial [Bacteroidota bacterium]|nr:hypothetical protein [Bacteroidota bacterium]
MRLFKWYYVLLLVSCSQQQHDITVKQQDIAIVIPSRIIDIGDSTLHDSNGYKYYRDSLFSGSIQKKDDNNRLRLSQTFWRGKEEGWLQTFYDNGKLESKRYFHKGEKDSVHTAWWPNGNMRLVHHYRNGNYDGVQTEYYTNGKILKQIWYNNGQDTSGKGWRETGKLFMNYVRKGDRRYGL